MTDQGSEPLSLDQPMTVWRYLRDQCDWPMREKMAYWCLYSRRGNDGKAPHPGLRRLAADMGTTPNAAGDAVDRLQAAGAVTVALRAGEKGQNIYTLIPPWEVQGPIAAPPRGVHARTASPNQTRVSETDTPPNQTRVSKTDTGGVSETATGGVSETETKQANNNEPMITSQISLLPVIENERDHSEGLQGSEGGTGVCGQKRKASKKAPSDEYSEDFEAFWAAYPRRKEKGKAWRVWLTRIGKGAKSDELITAAKHYAAECEAEGREEKYIKHAATFLGPDAHWREYLKPPETRQGGRPAQPGRGYVPHSKAQTQVPDMWKRKGGATA